MRSVCSSSRGAYYGGYSICNVYFWLLQVSEKRFVSCSEDGNIRVWDLFVPLLRLGTRADEDNIPTEIINKREFWGT